MATNNGTILTKAYLEGTSDAQQRIPAPDLANISAHVNALFDPMNRDIYNAWSAGLVNRIGSTIANNKRFTNPLAKYKKPYMAFGNSIQNIAIKWAEAHTYLDDSEDLLKFERPEFKSSFITKNRENVYHRSISRPEMRSAVSGDPSQYGINVLFDMNVTSLTNAEQYDEMNLMTELIKVADTTYGIFKVNIDKSGTKREQAQAILEAVKEYTNLFAFPSTLYNISEEPVPSFENDESNLTLLYDAKSAALVDVYAYAELFHYDKAKTDSPVTKLRELPIEGADVILTTNDFFICAPTEYGLYTDFLPNRLSTELWLQSQGVYGFNPFVPIVAIGSFPDVSVPTVTETVTGVEIFCEDEVVEAGGAVKLYCMLNGSISTSSADVDQGGVEVKPEACTWEITAAKDGVAVALNSRTYVDRNNVLHTQKTLANGTILTIKGTTVYGGGAFTSTMTLPVGAIDTEDTGTDTDNTNADAAVGE